MQCVISLTPIQFLLMPTEVLHILLLLKLCFFLSSDINGGGMVAQWVECVGVAIYRSWVQILLGAKAA